MFLHEQVIGCPPPRRLPTTHHSREEAQCLQVLEDVARLGGDEQHEQVLHGLVHVAHALRLDERVLGPAAHQLGEGRQQTLDAGACHLHKLSRHQG